MEQAGGGRGDARSNPAVDAGTAAAGVAPAREPRKLAPGRRRGSARRYYGLPPGAGRRELRGLTGDDARPGMGRNRKAGLRTRPAIRDWRGPTADDAAPIVRSMGSTTESTRRSPRWSAGRRGVPQGTSHTKDVAPTGAPSPLLFAERGKRNEAQPARHDKRAAERWLRPSS